MLEPNALKSSYDHKERQNACSQLTMKHIFGIVKDRTSRYYLHPTALSLRAYIFPISPIPIIPIEVPSMLTGHMKDSRTLHFLEGRRKEFGGTKSSRHYSNSSALRLAQARH